MEVWQWCQQRWSQLFSNSLQWRKTVSNKKLLSRFSQEAHYEFCDWKLQGNINKSKTVWMQFSQVFPFENSVAFKISKTGLKKNQYGFL